MLTAASLVVAVIALVSLPVVLAMRLEERRLGRALAAFAAALDEARVIATPGPGSWRLARVEGHHRGCRIRLVPVTVGGPRRSLAMRLAVHLPDLPGEGTLEVRQGDLATSGTLTPAGDPTVLRAALAAVGAVVTIAGREASTTVAPPRSPAAGQQLAALAAALATCGTRPFPR